MILRASRQNDVLHVDLKTYYSLWWNHLFVAKGNKMKLSYGTEDCGHGHFKILKQVWLKAIWFVGLPSNTFKPDPLIVWQVERGQQEQVQDCLHVNFLENQENQKGKGPDWMFDLDLLTPSMNYIPVRKENYADSKEQGITCDDAEDLDDQQFIVHTTQPMPTDERTAAKEVKLSSEDQALHD
ncbi:hypothetical protein Tco_1184358 [Tanacetum coccineum]